LDSIFTYLASPKALIMDIRFNRGGGEGVALQVAGRFTAKTSKGAYRYKRKKNGGYSDFVKLPSFRNKPHPSKRIKYIGPVYLLTNERTVSAGDLLALYMSQLPNVTIIGDNTEGSFDSFRYEFLPNGWHFSIPQKRYVRATDNISYEGVGIPPDIKVVNERKDIDGKVDRVLLRVFDEVK
jgi:C-terminal processing protease CtpA/Prc